MMHIVMIGARPEGQKMMQAPRKLVAAVGVNGLEEPQDDPQVHSQDVQVAGDGAPEDGDADGAEAED